MLVFLPFEWSPTRPTLDADARCGLTRVRDDTTQRQRDTKRRLAGRTKNRERIFLEGFGVLLTATCGNGYGARREGGLTVARDSCLGGLSPAKGGSSASDIGSARENPIGLICLANRAGVTESLCFLGNIVRLLL